MCHNDKIERCFLTDGDQLLELAERILVLTEEIRKFIPNQNNLCIILLNYIQNPCSQAISAQGQGSNRDHTEADPGAKTWV